MKAQNEKWPSLHEMLFENRNKQYGAYVIRKDYNDTVVKSLLFTICFFLSLVISAVVYNKLTEKPETILTASTDGNIETVYNTTPERVEPVKASAAPREASTFTPPVIIDDPNLPDPDNNLNQNSNTAPVAGNGGTGTDSSGTGNSTVTVIVSPPPTEPVLIAEKMPVFKGGMDKLVPFLSSNIVYPDRARNMGVEGTVFVSFVVDEEGNVGKIKILKGIGGDCDEEAIRVVAKMPKWVPGMNGGQNVKVMFNLPIRFKLN
ncbi:MAG: energy transducer TonB [Bacteroidia bacterium]